MAIRIFAIMAFFATVVLLPIHNQFQGFRLGFGGNETDDNSSTAQFGASYRPIMLPSNTDDFDAFKGGHGKKSGDHAYLWAYVVFTYFFAGLTIYTMNWETFRVIKYRQEYLGTQSTITDRTFRLTGIPSDLRSEDSLKNLIEKLDIGNVDSVTLCRDWSRLDQLVETRNFLLRKLERAWAKFHRQRKQSEAKGNGGAPTSNTSRGEQEIAEDADENGRLLESNPEQPHVMEGDRPQATIRYGAFGLRSRKVDAIDYYEEKLRRLDAEVAEGRKKTYTATDTALVTMDSVASCQMVIQARIDPRPGRLLTKTTPSPADLVWKNTYTPRGIRRLKAWAITLFITFLTLIWIFPTAFLASLLSICTIRTVAPSFAAWLQKHAIIYSLFQNGLPTLVVSGLNVAVPYLYDWLSNYQGMVSQGDVELSIISKNFFFTFFNTFFVFAVSRTGFDFWSVLRRFLQDTSQIPAAIFKDVEELSIFYTSFIMLQGIGMMPFRILEVGSVCLYPIFRLMSSTPRDYAELRRPPPFSYGFYLPTALLVFNLCLIYSVLSWGFAILIFGTLYFSLGYFTFKYLLLYAMDQPQHATGGAWRIICYRIVVGLLVFEVVMVGQVASLRAIVQSVLILPLIPFTIWYSYYFKQRFEPLTRYIALRAIEASEDPEESERMDEEFADEDTPRPSQGLLRRGSTLDEFREKGLKFVNPSLVVS